MKQQAAAVVLNSYAMAWCRQQKITARQGTRESEQELNQSTPAPGQPLDDKA